MRSKNNSGIIHLGVLVGLVIVLLVGLAAVMSADLVKKPVKLASKADECQGANFQFSGEGFKANEQVSVWVGFDQGRAGVVSLPDSKASGKGLVTYVAFSDSSWKVGSIRIFALGKESGHSSYKDFQYDGPVCRGSNFNLSDLNTFCPPGYVKLACNYEAVHGACDAFVRCYAPGESCSHYVNEDGLINRTDGVQTCSSVSCPSGQKRLYCHFGRGNSSCSNHSFCDDNNKSCNDHSEEEGLCQAGQNTVGQKSSHLSIFAGGTHAGGVGPDLQVFIGGQLIKTFQNLADGTQEYQVEVPQESVGVSQIKLGFPNDYYVNGQDRNLRVDKVILNGTTYDGKEAHHEGCGKGVWQWCSGFVTFSTTVSNDGNNQNSDTKNLVENGGFESWSNSYSPDKWNIWPNDNASDTHIGPVSRVTDSKEGSYALMIDATKPGSSNNITIYQNHSPLPIKPGKYDLTVWAKGVSSPHILIGFFRRRVFPGSQAPGGNWENLVQFEKTVGDSWEQIVSPDFTIDSSASGQTNYEYSLELAIHRSNGGKVLFDKLEFAQLPQ